MPKGRGQPDAAASAKKLKVAVVASRYNPEVMDRLLEGALAEHASLGGKPSAVTVLRAAGSFEVPQVAAAAAAMGTYDAVVALGCIIKGETRHDGYLAQAVTSGLLSVSMHHGVAVGLGVLTVDDEAQAIARAGGAMGNKGAEAMRAAVETALVMRGLS